MKNFDEPSVKKYVFDDPQLDNIKDYNYFARVALIKHEITKETYLLMEYTFQYVASVWKQLPDNAKSIMRESGFKNY